MHFDQATFRIAQEVLLIGINHQGARCC